MRARALWAEAWANLVSGTTRAALLALVFVATVGGLAAVDALAVLDVTDAAARFQASGATVHALRASEKVDGRRCDSLDGAAPIRGAGAVRAGTPVRALAMPDTQITTVDVTPGVLTILDVVADAVHEGDGDGVWLSADLADSLGARVGDSLATSSGTTRVAGIYTWPDDGRARDLGFAMLTPVPPTGSFDACWAEIWPGDQNATNLLHLTVTGMESQSKAELAQLNTRLGAEMDAARALDTRITRHTAVAAAAVGAAVGWGAIRLRRLEIASALHARVGKPDILAQHVIEAIAYTILAAVIAWAAVALLAAWRERAALDAIAAIAAGQIGAGAGGALLATIAGVAGCREKHLFVLFKGR